MAITESIGKGKSTNSSKVNPKGPRTLPGGFPLDNGLKGVGHAEYIIEKVLGDGGFGIVYKAKARMRSKNGRALSWTSFAVKEFFHRQCDRSETFSLVDKSEASFKEAKLRFKKEAEKLHELEIPNVVEVNECFERNNTVYYVMQFVEGQNLQEYVLGKDDEDGNGALSETDALTMMTPIIEAVEKLHENRLLHLDIKPNNIMLGKEGGEHDKYVSIGDNRWAPILIDFGTSASSNFINKKIDVKYRTQGYSSPEQSFPDAFGYKNEFDRRLDVYALGATMYFLLTGAMPADAPSRKEDFDDFINQITTRLKEKDVSESICDAVVKAMNPYRSQRTSSAREFLNELGAGAEFEAELKERNKRRNRRALMFLIAAILVGVAAIYTWNSVNKTVENNNRLQIAIEKHDKALLTEYAAADSLRAIKELVQVHEKDSNFLMAWYWTQYLKDRKDSIPGDKADIESIISRGEMLRQTAITKVDTSSNDFKNMAKLLGVAPNELIKSIEQPAPQPATAQATTPAQPQETPPVAETAPVVEKKTTPSAPQEPQPIKQEATKKVEKPTKKGSLIERAQKGDKDAIAQIKKEIGTEMNKGNVRKVKVYRNILMKNGIDVSKIDEWINARN